jgi:hypothetical protein
MQLLVVADDCGLADEDRNAAVSQPPILTVAKNSLDQHSPKPMDSVFLTRPKRAARISPRSSGSCFFLGGMTFVVVDV